ncbi:MAG: tRNA epoxyqueuosine(34) reductase QueG [Acidobacteria bacterium]|nr:tRNA epoxyqueuosine(34) reductase QueG [Acidobacteriota bacterium]
MNSVHERTRAIREAATQLGFDHCAAAPVAALDAAPRLREWLALGMHGSMQWMERSADRRAHPGLVVPEARSVLIVTRSYWTGEDATTDPSRGRISRYAWGGEYHDVLGAALGDLYQRTQEIAPGVVGRFYIDTGPVLEKAWAELAGLGWIGKHSNLITAGVGSWFFLGAIVLDCELAYGDPVADQCGSCTACIDVCPTEAIVAPYVVDARLCISYLTIENRGPIPRELRAGVGNRIFGCDECQDVCPWNRFAQVGAAASAFSARKGLRAPDLVDLLSLDEDGFSTLFRGSPVKRARYQGFLRNVAVALGNSDHPRAVAALTSRLQHESALVRGHCAWALGRFDDADARAALSDRLPCESDAWVREEIEAALAPALR